MSSMSCPSCKKPALERAKNPSFPFCSPRCRAVDLGKWLGEEFRVADASPELDEDGDQPTAKPDPEQLH